jgi:hypothetical protein
MQRTGMYGVKSAATLPLNALKKAKAREQISEQNRKQNQE